MGRPSDYGPDIAALICVRLAEGETLRAICRDDEMPGLSTVFRWLSEHGAFREQYARAREAQADAWADELIEIADDGTNDWMKRNGLEVVDGDHIQRSKLRIDARKWLMARAAPKKYGDKVALEHAGKDGGNLVVEIVRFGQDPAPE